jgi:hypothetical protein
MSSFGGARVWASSASAWLAAADSLQVGLPGAAPSARLAGAVPFKPLNLGTVKQSDAKTHCLHYRSVEHRKRSYLVSHSQRFLDCLARCYCLHHLTFRLACSGTPTAPSTATIGIGLKLATLLLIAALNLMHAIQESPR